MEAATGSSAAPRRASAREGHESLHVGSAQDGAVVFPGMIMWAAQPQRGPASPPGKYTVRDHRQRRNEDARLHDRHRSAAQGRRHHRGGPARAVQAVVGGPRQGDRGQPGGHQDPCASAIRSTIDSRSAGAPPREIQKLADGLLKPLTVVEEEVYQVRNRSGQDPLNYPIKLNNKIAALMGDRSNQSTDRSDLRGVQGAVGAARETAAADERDGESGAAAAQRRAEARAGRNGRSRRKTGAARQRTRPTKPPQ